MERKSAGATSVGCVQEGHVTFVCDTLIIERRVL